MLTFEALITLSVWAAYAQRLVHARKEFGLAIGNG